MTNQWMVLSYLQDLTGVEAEPLMTFLKKHNVEISEDNLMVALGDVQDLTYAALGDQIRKEIANPDKISNRDISAEARRLLMAVETKFAPVGDTPAEVAASTLLSILLDITADEISGYLPAADVDPALVRKDLIEHVRKKLAP